MLIVGDFNTSLTSMDRSSTEKINKETLALNDNLEQINLTYIYTEYFIQKQENTHSFFESTWNIPQDRLHASSQRKSQ